MTHRYGMQSSGEYTIILVEPLAVGEPPYLTSVGSMGKAAEDLAVGESAVIYHPHIDVRSTYAMALGTTEIKITKIYDSDGNKKLDIASRKFNLKNERRKDKGRLLPHEQFFAMREAAEQSIADQRRYLKSYRRQALRGFNKKQAAEILYATGGRLSP